jgi:hypothetical protein
MSGYALDPSLFESGGTYYGTGTGPSGLYTVLDAMSNNYYLDGQLVGSVFDQLATQTAKDNFAEFIRSTTTTSGTVAKSGEVKGIPANTTQTVDCSDAMVGTTWYTFLAVGRSAVGSGDAFRAIRPVFNTDDTPPMVTHCNFVMTSLAPDSLSDTCKGTLSIQFDEPLYWVEKDGVNQTIYPIVSKPGPGSSNVYDATMAFQPSGGFEYQKTENGTAAISTVTFKVISGHNGEFIMAATNVGDKSGNVHLKPLTITLNYTPNGDGTYTPTFTVTKDWDATT